MRKFSGGKKYAGRPFTFWRVVDLIGSSPRRSLRVKVEFKKRGKIL